MPSPAFASSKRSLRKTARSSVSTPAMSAFLLRQSAKQSMVAVWTDCDAVDNVRLADRVGVRHLANLPRPHHLGRTDGLFGLTQPVLHAHGVDDPHGLGRAACLGQCSTDI